MRAPKARAKFFQNYQKIINKYQDKIVKFVIFFALPVSASCPVEDQIQGQFLLRINNNINSGFSLKAQKDIYQTLSSKYNFKSIYKSENDNQGFKTLSKLSKAQADLVLIKDFSGEITELQNISGVLSVEPNCKMRAFATPNDTLYDRQWAHQIIHYIYI